MIVIYFASGGSIDDVDNNRTNHQFTSAIAVHFIIVQECVGLSKELFLMCTSIETTDENMNTTSLKGVMNNQDIKRIFSRFRQFLYLSVYL